MVAEVLAKAKDEFDLGEPQIEVLETKLDLASSRQQATCAFDWLNLAVGVFVDRAATSFSTPEVVHKVLSALDVGLGALFGHPPMLGR